MHRLCCEDNCCGLAIIHNNCIIRMSHNYISDCMSASIYCLMILLLHTCTDGTFQATARFQDSDFFQKAIKKKKLYWDTFWVIFHLSDLDFNLVPPVGRYGWVFLLHRCYFCKNSLVQYSSTKLSQPRPNMALPILKARKVKKLWILFEGLGGGAALMASPW